MRAHRSSWRPPRINCMTSSAALCGRSCSNEPAPRRRGHVTTEGLGDLGNHPRLLRMQGSPIDVSPHSTYLQVSALPDKSIDIAWNSPLAWLDSQRRSNSGCRAIAMRDTDRIGGHFVARSGTAVRAVSDRGPAHRVGAPAIHRRRRSSHWDDCGRTELIRTRIWSCGDSTCSWASTATTLEENWKHFAAFSMEKSRRARCSYPA